jgi:hypothetical protein
MENSKSNLQLEYYSEKSFVVKGDTRYFKDDLKKMGGKWNSNLTNKTTGEKFGAWLFWSNKRPEIEIWLRSEMNTDSTTSSTINPDRLEQVEEVLCKIISLFEKLDPSNGLNQTNFYKNFYKRQTSSLQSGYSSDDNYDEESSLTPQPRLLKTKSEKT